MPAAQRPVTFLTGQRDYDPVKLGLELDRTKFNLPPGLELFTFDTRIAGNWNTGHEWDFYPNLNARQPVRPHRIHQDLNPAVRRASQGHAGLARRSGVTTDDDPVTVSSAATPATDVAAVVPARTARDGRHVALRAVGERQRGEVQR
jgi:hypothetical protein